MKQTEAAPPDPGRRYFLLAASGAGALGAIALLAGRGAASGAAAQAVPASAALARGYHETEHIRSYYRTASYW